jgi:hypothetical protein
MNKNILIRFMLALFCCWPVFAQEEADPNNWDKLNLSSTTIAGVKVYYEKCFEPNLPFFEGQYKKLLERKSKVAIIKSKKDQILADINNIFGIEDVNTAMLGEGFSEMLDALASIEIKPLYIVKQSTIKSFLRSGGHLPDFEYDETEDLVKYKPNLEFTSKDETPGNLEFTFLIESVDSFETEVTEYIGYLKLLLNNMNTSLVIHELAEMSLFMRARPGDPYWRWFTEGVANSVAYEIVKKYVGIKDANEFIEAYDVKQYEDIKKEINLKFWMSVDYSILPMDMPTPKGQKFSQARYAYGTLEVRKLIEEHGIDCIRKILDEICAMEPRTGDDLLITIRNITGENMYLRFVAYQSFGRKQEGIEKYGQIYNEASGRNDYEQMAINILRAHELRSPDDVKQYMADYIYVSTYLFKMGFEAEADKTMNNCLKLFSQQANIINSRAFALDGFIAYALSCDKPLKAREEAKELLKLVPDTPNALVVLMYEYLENNQPDQAYELAKKIKNLSKSEQSISYKKASSVLSAYDPNQIRLEN